jgi:hypothetical protein
LEPRLTKLIHLKVLVNNRDKRWYFDLSHSASSPFLIVSGQSKMKDWTPVWERSSAKRRGDGALAAVWSGFERWIRFRRTKSRKRKRWIRSGAALAVTCGSPCVAGATGESRSSRSRLNVTPLEKDSIGQHGRCFLYDRSRRCWRRRIARPMPQVKRTNRLITPLSTTDSRATIHPKFQGACVIVGHRTCIIRLVFQSFFLAVASR